MRIATVRSGLVEAVHEVAVVAVGSDGSVAAVSGPDVDRDFYLRSAAKPFQTAVAQLCGAGLTAPEHLAVASASHGGQPVHIAHVRAMLSGAGLGEDDLRCPPARPMSITADRRAAARGEADLRPIFNNCSGKHAAMLRACGSSNWSPEYRSPEHPLQRMTIDYVNDVIGGGSGSVGVDGCGVPTIRSSVTGLARAYHRLATDSDLAPIADAMYRFGSLTADGNRSEAMLTRWGGGPAKGGAMGCIAIAHSSGCGVAAKSWSGQIEVAVVGLVAMLRRLGLLADNPFAALADVAAPPVLGGGEPVGMLKVVED